MNNIKIISFPNDIHSMQDFLAAENSDYLLFLPEQFALAYDDALQDALMMMDGAPLACFGTIYEADKQNKFDAHWRNPLLNPSIADLVAHPSHYLACIMSREVYKNVRIFGNNIYEAVMGIVLSQPIDSCKFIPLNILTTTIHASDIDSLVNKTMLRNLFCQLHPMLSKDYHFLFQKLDLATDEESLVMEKLKNTRFFKFIMSFRKLLHKVGYYKTKANYKYRQYIKNVRREDAARIADIATKIEALPYNMLQAKGDESDIVVSLTTHGKRLYESAPYGIYSLFTQTILPNRIVLSINQDDWNEDNLPPLIKRLQKSGLEVIFCQDVRSHTKLLPALAKYPNNPIITVDDDMCYEPHMIEELVTAYAKSDKKTVLCRQGVYPKKKDGRYIPYMQWEDSPLMPDAMQNKMAYPVSPYGVYGVLYPAHIFDNEIFRDDIFLKLAPHTDDIWFWLQEVRCGVNAEVVRPSRQKLDGSVSLLEYLEEAESSALYFQNCFCGRNDKEMYALLDYYKM